MLSLSRRIHYGLTALVDLAGQGPAVVSARDISEKFRLPLPALTNILNSLARAGLVVSTRGPKGGYRLAKPARQISITSLIEAVEGTMQLTACSKAESHDGGSPCEREEVCPITETMRRLHGIFHGILSQVTLDQVLADEVPSGVLLGVGADRGDGTLGPLRED